MLLECKKVKSKVQYTIMGYWSGWVLIKPILFLQATWLCVIKTLFLARFSLWLLLVSTHTHTCTTQYTGIKVVLKYSWLCGLGAVADFILPPLSFIFSKWAKILLDKHINKSKYITIIFVYC